MNPRKVKTLRTLEMHARYEKHCATQCSHGCYLCRANPVKDYRYWKIIDNEFPYDEVATVSHMLVPKKHVKEDKLNLEEFNELEKIKPKIHEAYDLIIENTHKLKSIPEHYHLHLLEMKEREMIEESGQRPFFQARTLNLTK